MIRLWDDSMSHTVTTRLKLLHKSRSIDLIEDSILPKDLRVTTSKPKSLAALKTNISAPAIGVSDV